MGIAQWLEHRTCDRKGTSLNPPQEQWKNLFLQGQLSVLTLILVSIPSRVTTVACSILCGFKCNETGAHSNGVHRLCLKTGSKVLGTEMKLTLSNTIQWYATTSIWKKQIMQQNMQSAAFRLLLVLSCMWIKLDIVSMLVCVGAWVCVRECA